MGRWSNGFANSSGRASRPSAAQDTIEIFAFMEAADESKRLGGRPVAITTIIARAEQAANDKDCAGPPAPAAR